MIDASCGGPQSPPGTPEADMHHLWWAALARCACWARPVALGAPQPALEANRCTLRPPAAPSDHQSKCEWWCGGGGGAALLEVSQCMMCRCLCRSHPPVLVTVFISPRTLLYREPSRRSGLRPHPTASCRIPTCAPCCWCWRSLVRSWMPLERGLWEFQDEACRGCHRGLKIPAAPAVPAGPPATHFCCPGATYPCKHLK